MPLIKHSDAFYAKQRRKALSREKALAREKFIAEQTFLQIESKEKINKVKELTEQEELIRKLKAGEVILNYLSQNDYQIIFDLIRYVRRNPLICKEIYNKTAVEMFSQFQEIQDICQANIMKLQDIIELGLDRAIEKYDPKAIKSKAIKEGIAATKKNKEQKVWGNPPAGLQPYNQNLQSSLIKEETLTEFELKFKDYIHKVNQNESNEI
jgi:hypothetical protein